MKNTFGNAISVTLFGESHGEVCGAVIDGLAPGIKVDNEYIDRKMALRRPSGEISTARREKDEVIFLSGVYRGYTTGAPVCVIIKNTGANSGDYEKYDGTARPGHCDYTAFCKYHGYEDRRGGGHHSGRLTAPLVAAGALVQSALREKGIVIGTQACRIAGIDDIAMIPEKHVPLLESAEFPVLDRQAAERMKNAILNAKQNGNSVGGILKTAAIGIEAGAGEPWFDSAESVIAHALFSIPAVKGVEFGDGFALSDMTAPSSNDALRIRDGKVVSETNHCGGINGGITNGSPLIIRCAVKPTPSVSAIQRTVDFVSMKDTEISVCGRHDPCIVHRARAAVDAVVALALADLLVTKHGTDWLAER